MSASGAARSAAVVGFLLAGAAILLIGFLLDNRAPNYAVPPLRIVPDTADVVRNPVVLQFVTPANLRLTPAGWAAGSLHLHLNIDGQERMAAAADLTASPGLYTWRLPRLPPGTHRISLSWAGQHHGTLPASIDTVTVRVVH